MTVLPFTKRRSARFLPPQPREVDLFKTQSSLMLVEQLVPAGVPHPANDAGGAYLNLNEHVSSSSDTPPLAFEVRDMAMQQSGIKSGDVVIIDRMLRPHDGALVLVRLNLHYFLRRFFRTQSEVILYADDPELTSLVMGDNPDLEILGVVTHTVARL